jgi:predicted RNA-binding protein YlqC (UPF0109 family)
VREFLEYIVTSLVDHPEAVEVREERSGNTVHFQLVVDPSDAGKVIGHRGQVIEALRALLRVAATREGVRATLELQRRALGSEPTASV